MKSIFSKILYVLVLLAVSLPAMAQRNVITGVVYDESGLPLTCLLYTSDAADE